MPAPAVATSFDAPRSTVLKFDEFELDIRRFELRHCGESVPVEPQVFEVLWYLVQRADRVVTKDELLDNIWPHVDVSEASLNSRMTAARKAIGDSGQLQRYIKTVHRRGYRFVGDVITTGTSPSLSVVPDPVPVPLQPPPSMPMAIAPETTFIGRSEELGRIEELLARPECRLISIVGPGGVGKTRLALRAADLASTGGRTVAVAPLESIADPGKIPAVVAEALGLSLRTEDPAGELLAYLSSRRDIIVLDNFEHLLKGAPFLHKVLRSAPGITLLVTSRSVLGLSEEWVLRVSGLRVSADGERSEATQLFLERAAQANAWTESRSVEDLQQIAEICGLVDGMPLAIELAASLTRYLTFGEIATEIGRDISVLSRDIRNAPGRQRSIAVLLEESCGYLQPDELEALESLVVFEGPFTAAAAHRVAGAPLPLMRKLVDHSLVQAAQGRFSLHPLLRRFLLERLDDRDLPVRERHARFYSELAGSLRHGLEGAGQAEGARLVDENFLNLACAWRWAADNGRLDLMQGMAYPLFLALTFRGRFFDADDLLQHGIRATRGAGTAGHELLTVLLSCRAWMLLRFGCGDDAAEAIKGALALQSATGSTLKPGLGLDPRLPLAALYHGGGDYANATETALAVLEEALSLDEPATAAFASWVAASARMRQARLVWEGRPDGTCVYRSMETEAASSAIEEASRLARGAQAILNESGDSWLSALVEIELGVVATATGDQESALVHYRRAYELRRALDDPQGMASVQVYIADGLINLRRCDQADALHQQIRALAQSIGSATSLAEVERSMALGAVERGDYPRAFECARMALQRSIAMGFTNNIASILACLSQVFRAVGEPELAAQCAAVIVGQPASTPFARARAEALLNAVSETLPRRVMSEVRQRAAQLDLIKAALQAVAALEGMQDRLAATARPIL